MAGFALGLIDAGLRAGRADAGGFALCREFFGPILSVVKATPVASFILLALVWLRVSNVPVCTAVLIVTPVAYSNVFTGLAALDPDLLEMAGRVPYARARAAEISVFSRACCRICGRRSPQAWAWRGRAASPPK